MARYRVVTGINVADGKGGEKRYEAGQYVADLSDEDTVWLLECGAIVAPKPKTDAPAAEEVSP